MKLTDIESNETVEEADNAGQQIPLDQAFGPDSEQERQKRNRLLFDFKLSVGSLIKQATEEAYELGGEFKGPGITVQLEKILKDFTFRR